MKTSRLLLATLVLAATPLFAADRHFELTGWAAWVNSNSNAATFTGTGTSPFDIRFNGKLGYGLGANIFFGDHLAGSFDVVQVRPDTFLRTRSTGGSFLQDGYRMTPITAVVQWHFIPRGFIDPYLGAGAAYVLFDTINGRGVPSLSRIDFKDDAGLAVNGGIGFALGRSLAITVDGKYIPLKSSADAVFIGTGGTVSRRVKINPAIFSTGLTWRF